MATIQLISQKNPFQQQQSSAFKSNSNSGVVLTQNGLQSSAGIPSALVSTNLGKVTVPVTNVNQNQTTPTPAPTQNYIEQHTNNPTPVSQTNQNYNQNVENEYNNAIKYSGVNIQSGIGDNVAGFGLNDVLQSGYQYGNDVWINRLFSPLPSMEKNTIAHEFGHYLQTYQDIPVTDNVYAKSSTDNIFQTVNRAALKGMYGSEQSREDFANSFMNFVKNPSEFRSEYPQEAQTFENALNFYKAPSATNTTVGGKSGRYFFGGNQDNNPLNPSVGSGIVLTDLGVQSSAGIPSGLVKNNNNPSGIILTESGLQSSSGISPNLVGTPARNPVSLSTTVTVNADGTVTEGGVNYGGKSIVPNTGGLTANEIDNQVYAYYKSEGKDIRYGGYNTEVTFGTEENFKQPSTITNIPIHIINPAASYFNNEGLNGTPVDIYPAGTFIQNSNGTIQVIQPVGSPRNATPDELQQLKDTGQIALKDGKYTFTATAPQVIYDNSGKSVTTRDVFQYKPYKEGTISGYKPSTETTSDELKQFGSDLLQSSTTLLWGGDMSFNPLFSKARGDVAQILNDEGSIGKIINSGLPDSMLSTALIIDTAGAYKEFPQIAKLVIGTYVTYTGTKGALNKDLSAEQRIADVLIAGAGIYGFTEAVNPYLNAFEPYKVVAEYDMALADKSRTFELDVLKLDESGNWKTLRINSILTGGGEGGRTVTTTNAFREYFGFKPISVEIFPEATDLTITAEPTSLNARSVSYQNFENNFLASGNPTRNYQTNFDVREVENVLGEIPLVEKYDTYRVSSFKEGEADLFFPFKEQVSGITGEVYYPRSSDLNGFLSARIASAFAEDYGYNVLKYATDEDIQFRGSVNYLSPTGDVIRTRAGVPMFTTIGRIIEDEDDLVSPVKLLEKPKFPSLSDVKATENILDEGVLSESIKRETLKPKAKTPLSKIFGDEKIIQEGEQADKQVLQQRYIRRTLPKATTVLKPSRIYPVNDNLPSMVGGQGLYFIPFEGQGLYEVSETSILSRTDVMNKPIVMLNQEPQIKTFTILNQGELFKENVLEKQNELLKNDVILKQDVLQKQNQLERQNQLFKINEITNQDIFGNPFGDEETGEGILPPLSGNKKKQARIGRQVPTYNVLLRRRGRFTQIAGGLPRGQALEFGSEKALKDLARTFRIIPTGKTTEVFGQFDEGQFMPRQTQFRGYKVRRGVQIQTPDQFIQKTSANLQSYEEKSQIADAKRLSKLMNFKI